MSKIVRIENGVVREVIPAEATTPNVTHWYGEAFAAECVEAPDNVCQGWAYDGAVFIPPTTYTPTINDIRASKLTELSSACQSAIFAGVNVTTSYGAEHFSMSLEDQINIKAMGDLGNAGSGWPYHPDGGACKMYTAADLVAIQSAASAWKTQQLTYYNFMRQWVEREIDTTAVQSIAYGDELPVDLATAMTALLEAVNGSST